MACTCEPNQPVCPFCRTELEAEHRQDFEDDEGFDRYDDLRGSMVDWNVGL